MCPPDGLCLRFGRIGAGAAWAGAEPPVSWQVQKCPTALVCTNAEVFVQQEGVRFGSPGGAVAVIQARPLNRQAVFGVAERLLAVAFHERAAFEPDDLFAAPPLVRLAARLGTAVALDPDEP